MLWRSNGGLQTSTATVHHSISTSSDKTYTTSSTSPSTNELRFRLTTPASKPQRSVKSKASTGKLKKRKDASAPLFRRTWWRKDRLTFYHIKDVPRYLQDNPYIHTGYRSGYSYRENWISFFHLHNESFNVWTHTLGALFFIALAFAATFQCLSIFLRHVEIVHTADKAILIVNILCATTTFTASAMYHLHLSHSEEACKWFGCLDYSGISASVFGNALTLTYFLHYCNPLHFLLWLLPIALTNLLGIVGPFIIPTWPQGSFRPYRTLLYLLSAGLSLSPLPVYLITHAWSGNWDGVLPDVRENWAMVRFGAGVCAYLLGCVVYVGKLPESLFPGKFDLFFHSHQIWHVFCMIAALLHVNVVLDFIEWRKTATCSM